MTKSIRPDRRRSATRLPHRTAPENSREGRSAARTLVLFPGALGDFLCALPAIRALGATSARLTLVARPEVFPLLDRREFDPVSIDRREVADLFADGPIAEATRRLFGGHARTHSWTGHGNAGFRARLEKATGGPVSIHPFRDIRPGEHACDAFLRCVELGRVPIRVEPGAEACRWAARFWERHGLGPRTLALHPGSGGRAKNWEGMTALADRWRERHGPVLAILGPAEREAGGSPAADARAREEPLDRVAALLRLAHRYVGNDSGISHLAGALGATGVVLFGPTRPETWRPPGESLVVLDGAAPCPECGPQHLCLHRIPVERVVRLLARDGSPARSGVETALSLADGGDTNV